MAYKTNRQLLTKGKNYATKQLKKFGTDEVGFDKDSRLDYLTGFHKRKLERRKKAQESIKEQERQLRIEERKKVRDERKKQMDEQMKRFKETLDIQAEIEEMKTENNKKGEKKDEVNESDDSWNGFSDDESDSSVKPILKTNVLGTAIYDDETVVEVESLEPNENFEFLAKTNNVELSKSEKILDESITRAKKYAKFLGMDDSKDKKKQKKKKFRYLTKNERKNNQRKAYQNKHRR
ncbi:Rrp17 protein [Maudiozyma humilis]|uniref:Rrp17 protein n=1 Tax=Maudiozyma humilis TaxID=51915 RepID=A0AAV5S5H7_MAUHU|nr:Rrp17 protein [Kazachstania humilis]